MRNVRGTRHSLPNTRTLTAIAQDPSIKFRDKILTTELRIPAEDLLPGPCGYRVNVIDYDSTTNTLYEPMTYGEQDSRGKYVDPLKLLFPGDAQIENWQFALQQNKYRSLLSSVNLYKVGHHGSRNATPKSLWKLFKNKSEKK